MSTAPKPQPDEVEHLLRNAQLRDELEPYFDESIVRVNVAEVPTPVENEFLASMLAWERAPVLPISEWFEPKLTLPPPETLSDGELHDLLWQTIHKLFAKRIVLDFTDHLSDRALYCLICATFFRRRKRRSIRRTIICTGTAPMPAAIRKCGCDITRAKKTAPRGRKIIPRRCPRANPALPAPNAARAILEWRLAR